MIKIEVKKDVDKEEWNSLLGSANEATIQQTPSWAEYMKDQLKAEPIYIIAKDEKDSVVGLLLILKMGYACESFTKKKIGFIAIPILKTVLPYYSWIEGPVILDIKRSKEIFEAILDGVDKLAKKEKVYMIKGHTLPYGDLKVENLDNQFISHILENYDFKFKKWGTFLINLDYGEEEILGNIKKEARKNVKKCSSNGVHVILGTDKVHLDIYHKLIVETRKRLKLGLPPHYPDKIMLKHLKKHDHAEIFFAQEGSKVIAAMGAIGFNKTFKEIGSGLSNYAIGNKIYAGDLIKWEMIKWGIKRGYRWYDLGGVNPAPKEGSKEEGILKFKQKWGGELVTYYLFEKEYSKFKQKIVKIMKKVWINLYSEGY